MRINLFGGPGAGKSTTAAWLFSQLKDRRESVEHVAEYVKAWAYQKRPVMRYDQVYLFAKQQQYEYRFLKAGVKHIVTDCPCFLSIFYAGAQTPLAQGLWTILQAYDEEFPVVNIFLVRGAKEYIQEGRYHTHEQAKEIDKEMLALLKKYYPTNTIAIDFKQRETVLGMALNAVSWERVLTAGMKMDRSEK